MTERSSAATADPCITLAREVKASFALFEPLARREIGNTNFNVIVELADAVLSRVPAQLQQEPPKSIDEIAVEITEEIRCEERARERVAKADEVSGDIYLLKVLLSVIASQNAAIREYETSALPPPNSPTPREDRSWVR